jgi:putative lysine transport system ATP-binding protein
MLLRIKDLHKSFNGVEILKGINLGVSQGEIITILGSSGGGKSTLLRTINALEDVNSGSIIFDGVDITNTKENINKIRSQIGFVFQSFNLFANLNVLNNCILAPMKVLKLSKQEAIQTAIEKLKLVKMDEFMHRDISTLSGGQKQRVAIARALCMKPKIMLFDEPTSALDVELTQEVEDVIKELKNAGQTMIIVTHEIALAKQISTRVIFIDKGVILEEGTVDEIFNHPKQERTRLFLSL